MQLASTGFCTPIRQTSTPKPVGALSARLNGKTAGQKPAGRPRSSGALPPGVTVFANAINM
jgi:hypothetical protein